jgi:hypothetical protein
VEPASNVEHQVNEQPRLTTLMGIARAALTTVGPESAARVLIDEHGWDATFHALALLRGDDARTAFGRTWSELVFDDLEVGIERASDPRLGPAPIEEGGPGMQRRG